MIQSSLSTSVPSLVRPGRPCIVVISGSPRPGSRTLAVAHSLVERIADDLPHAGVEVVDLAVLTRVLFDDDGRVAAAARTAMSADLLVVASPVYKGSFTGLLKVFLDLLPGGALRGVTAVPLILSAAPDHSFAAETYLRPVLVELGAVVPGRSFAVIEDQLPDLDIVIDSWAVSQVPALRASIAANAGAERVAAPSALSAPTASPRPARAAVSAVSPLSPVSAMVPVPAVARVGILPVLQTSLAEAAPEAAL